MSHARGLGLALLLTLGCRTAPVGTPERLDPTSDAVQTTLTSFLAQTRAHRALRGSARVALEGVRGASFARHLVVLELPARVRMEVMGLAGQRIAVLATNGEHYDLYRAETAKVERGRVHAGLLAEVGGVPLAPAELVPLLLGGLPIQVGRLTSAVRGADGRLALTWEASAGGQLTVILDDEGLLTSLRLDDPSGQELVVASYSDYRSMAQGMFAHQVRLDFGSRGVRVEVNFRQVELDPELPEGLFRLELVSSPGG